MTAVEVVQQIGDLLVFAAAGIGTASVVVHARVEPPWWSSAMGRHLMAYMAAMAAVLDLAVVRLVAGLDATWFAVLRVAVFAAVPAVMGWRLAIQLRARRDDAPPRRGPGGVSMEEDRAMTIFGREPTLFLQVISAVLSFAVASNLGLTDTQAALIVAAISAVFGAINAVLVRPVAPAAFTGVIAAVAALATGFGFNVSPETVAAVNGLVLAGLAFLVRAQVSPTLGARRPAAVR